MKLVWPHPQQEAHQATTQLAAVFTSAVPVPCSSLSTSPYPQAQHRSSGARTPSPPWGKTTNTRSARWMACLVPQLKCPPATDSHLRLCHISSIHFVKSKDHVCVRKNCILSSMTSVVDVDKLQIPSLETHSTSLTARTSDATLATEKLLKDEDAVIAAAAAEAVALARAALEVAKDAAQIIGTNVVVTLEKTQGLPAESNLLLREMVKLSELEEAAKVDHSSTFEEESNEDLSTQVMMKSDLSDLTQTELEDNSLDFPDKIAVRSGRQSERRARRARATTRATATVLSMKSGSSSRRKRPPVQDVDYTDPLRYLRGTTSISRLLTANEELELSKAIQELLKLENLHEELVERNGGQPTFAQWAAAAGIDQRTLRKRLSYGAVCKDKMIKSNIRLVISIAKNYQGAGMNLQDLVQEGCRGLVKGAEKFDASKGFKFSTYAHWWIKQAVRKSLSDQSRTIRLPFHMVEATYRVKEAKKQLYSENGRYPDTQEIVEATGLSMKRLTAVMLTPKAPRSLDQKVGFNQNLKLSEVIADPDAESSEEILMKEFMKQDLNKVLNSLNPREKQVIRWRFGLEDGRMKTLQEIGELMGISRERVRQIESCAFRKLKNKKRIKHLKQYVVS
ncbi:RNA polymerase sigma factor SigB/C/D/F plastid protein [Dioscorea alata]|uniref:RNA polymerase sigma factor SigB/C/D/F plastid protein n=1 Tax=Dioscorea alata TaxID=55571 RepID=A0ACB7WH06_DIOAL|nr:RNA polymerase sigma factor SigB/C/D/F plastid protein [Dioscorea alata]